MLTVSSQRDGEPRGRQACSATLAAWITRSAARSRGPTTTRTPSHREGTGTGSVAAFKTVDLAGYPIDGHFTFSKPGHAINNKLLHALFADESAYAITTGDEAETAFGLLQANIAAYV